MKKQYIVPKLYFESFVLSESIAWGCDPDGISGAEGLNTFDGYFLDTSNNMQCSEFWTPEDDGKWEGYCYWNGTSKLFTS